MTAAIDIDDNKINSFLTHQVWLLFCMKS